jgi:hypothetical protein
MFFGSVSGTSLSVINLTAVSIPIFIGIKWMAGLQRPRSAERSFSNKNITSSGLENEQSGSFGALQSRSRFCQRKIGIPL